MRSNASSQATRSPSSRPSIPTPMTEVRWIVSELASGLRKGVGAGDGLRTRYLNLGKVALYRVSYSRVPIGAHVTQTATTGPNGGSERRLVGRHVEPGGGARVEPPELDQVAQLVGHPQTAMAVPVARRPLAAGERVIDPLRGTDLAYQRVVDTPDPEAAPRVAQAVGHGHDGKQKVLHLASGEAHTGGQVGHKAAKDG